MCSRRFVCKATPAPAQRPHATAQVDPDAIPDGPPSERPPGITEDTLPHATELGNRGQLLAYATKDLGYPDTRAVLEALELDAVQAIPIVELHETGQRLREIAIERRKTKAVAR